MCAPFARLRPALPILCGLLAVLPAACGEAERASEEPMAETPALDEGTRIRVDVALTYHRGESPVRVSRAVEIPVGGPGAAAAPELLLVEAFEALLAGPTAEEREAGIHSSFSDETADLLRSVSIEDDRAVVDFHDFRTLLPNVSASAASFAFLAELNGTVFSNSLVEEVEYRMAGSCEAFWNFLQRDCTVVPRPTDV